VFPRRKQKSSPKARPTVRGKKFICKRPVEGKLGTEKEKTKEAKKSFEETQKEPPKEGFSG